MQFKKDHQKAGGRKKGTPNKTNAQHHNRLSAISDFFEETLKEDAQSLSPTERLKFWLAK